MERASAKKPIAVKHHFDFPLFAAVMVICAFGLVMLFSASYYYAQEKFGSGTYFLKRQLIFFGIGLVSMLGLSHLKFKAWKSIAPWAYFGVMFFLALTLVIGVKINEARRWINIAGFQFQPSEFAKFAIVIALSAAICSKRLNMQNFVIGVLPCLGLLAPYVLLVLLQPNFSLVLILCLTTYAMIYLGGTRKSHRLFILVVGLLAGAAVIALKSYRSARITSWLNPSADPTGSNYQAIQSRIALGSGGFFGQGLNFSRQKLGFLPEMVNDYILAIIGEELGFLGCFALLSAYVFVIYRGITVAMRCQDRFGKLLAGGITAVIAIQVIINIGVVTSAIPSTGQALPFISYGGTSLIVFMSAVGVILNISRYSEVNTENADGTGAERE